MNKSGKRLEKGNYYYWYFQIAYKKLEFVTLVRGTLLTVPAEFLMTPLYQWMTSSGSDATRYHNLRVNGICFTISAAFGLLSASQLSKRLAPLEWPSKCHLSVVRSITIMAVIVGRLSFVKCVHLNCLNRAIRMYLRRLNLSPGHTVVSHSPSWCDCR